MFFYSLLLVFSFLGFHEASDNREGFLNFDILGGSTRPLNISVRNEKQMKLQVIFWPVQPFIYFPNGTESNRLNGIIPNVFFMGGAKCTPSAKTDILNFTVNLKTRKLYEETIRNYTSIPEGVGVLSNITTPRAVLWGPSNTYFGKIETTHILERQLEMFEILTSEKLVVIFPRWKISAPIKMMRGVKNCEPLLVTGFILAIIFGLLFWLFERPYNENFGVITGPATGLYLSLVTMTTVGYGDITPVTFFGRTLACVWMFVGMVIASLLTATVSETATGIRGMEIDGRSVAVLKDSHEENIIKQDYSNEIHLYNSYGEIIEAVHREDVYAGVLPLEIASWMQEVITDPNHENPLSMVFTLPGKVKFRMFLSKTPFPFAKELLDCMFSQYKEAVVQATLDNYARNVALQTIYYGSGILNPESTAALFGIITCVLVLLAIGFILSKIGPWKVNKPTVSQQPNDQQIKNLMKELSQLVDKYQIINDNNKSIEMGKVNPPLHSK